LLAGAGQLWQHRYNAGAAHLLTSIACSVAAFRYDSVAWTLAAAAVNVWSAIEAAWWARQSGEEPDSRD
jgi:hypothetical protein